MPHTNCRAIFFSIDFCCFFRMELKALNARIVWLCPIAFIFAWESFRYTPNGKDLHIYKSICVGQSVIRASNGSNKDEDEVGSATACSQKSFLFCLDESHLNFIFHIIEADQSAWVPIFFP